MKNLKAKVEIDKQHKVPRRIFDIQSNKSKREPQAIAEATLKKIASELKIKSDLSQLKFDQVKDSILGKHVLYQQQFQGKPISGAWIRVDIDNEGKVFNIQNDLVPEPVLKKSESLQSKKNATAMRAKATGQLTADEVKTLALEAVKPSVSTPEDVVETELLFYPANSIPTLAWKVILNAEKPKAEYKIYFDAVTGAVIDKINLLKYAEGVGLVFDPNPVVMLNDTKLEDTSVIPDSAYKQVKLPDLKNTGMLDGPFVNTSTTRNRVKKSDLKFLFKRDDRAFKEVMVYFHIDSVQRYIQSLGFTNVLNKSIAVNTDGTVDDQSFYSPVTKSLTFGTGGVDDAEDAEIVLHEYGHALLDDQVPGFGRSKEAEAISEAFGDYLAASFFSDKKPAILKPTIGNWDAVAYSGGEPPCLRRLDSNKKYPKDIKGEPHDDGEIWSACLWEVRAALGRTITDKLVIAHHFLLSPQAGFEDAANALITADKNLNNGQHEDAIRNVFVNRGILPNPQRKNIRAGAPSFDSPMAQAVL
jgi:Zn-dependent metalloprotease